MPDVNPHSNQQDLFADVPALPAATESMQRDTGVAQTEAPMSERRRKARLAWDAADDLWKMQTYTFAVRDFLPGRETFIFEDLTKAYEAAAERFDWTRTEEGRAFVGLRNALVFEGKIEKLEGRYGTRSQGSPSPLYRSRLYVKPHIDEVRIEQ